MRTIKLLDRWIRNSKNDPEAVKVYELAKKFIETDNVAALQKYMGVAVDSILGPVTVGYMFQHSYSSLLNLFNTLGNSNISLKSKIMDYLAAAEGRHLHWNKTETGFTTMYGIYSRKHKRSKPIQYIRRRARELGFRNITRKNIKQLDRALTTNDKTILADLIYDYYVKTMFIKEAIPYLSHATYLTYFSLAVHGGRGRGIKALKSALGRPLSKRWYDADTRALKNTSKSDIEINNGMLDYMQSFYDYLIRKNPSKYKVYKRGWSNRLDRLRRYVY